VVVPPVLNVKPVLILPIVLLLLVAHVLLDMSVVLVPIVVMYVPQVNSTMVRTRAHSVLQVNTSTQWVRRLV